MFCLQPKDIQVTVIVSVKLVNRLIDDTLLVNE